MNKQQFTNKINFIFEDKNIEKPSIEWLNGLYEKCKNIDDKRFGDGVDKLTSIPQDHWNEIYGFRGRPNIIDLVETLSGERPLSDYEKLEANRKHEEKLRIWVGIIINWITDQNLDILFKNKYHNEENRHLTALINKYAKKTPTNEEEIVLMGQFLKRKFDADRVEFKARLKGIAEQQNPPLFTIEFKAKESNITPLLTLKKI
jgi:hypothetical protein